jgi:hypothetical protein
MFFPELADVPPILDFEASSLSDNSYPISAGLVIGGHVHYWVIKPKYNWIERSSKSEAIHGLSREFIEIHGISADKVLAEISEKLNVYDVVYSDNPEWEAMWLSSLGRLDIKIVSIYTLITQKQREHFSLYLDINFLKNNLARHRADHDALAMALTIEQISSSL